jgi:hypothetical protein
MMVTTSWQKSGLKFPGVACLGHFGLSKQSTHPNRKQEGNGFLVE